MTKAFKKYLVTAALPYANGPVHIGHLAGCYLPADIYVRYLKAQGKDVLFICGSDEHGVPITIKAKKENISPQQVVDKYHQIMKQAFADFGIDFTYYGRTSSDTHKETAQSFFKNLYDKGVFKEETTQQFYDEKAQQFLADRYITGTCPKCSSPGAYGDQCEKCGSSLNAIDLINPSSMLSGDKPVLKETKNWFLPMGDIQSSAAFKQYIERIENWKSNIKGQCNSWLNEGLQPRAMTRDLDWGVPVPLPNAEGKVLYVWFDAPIGYISATKEYLQQAGRINELDSYWNNEETALIHFIGKDNIVFHAIIFPMMLMTHGNYNLPVNIPANEFLNLEGDKISTSKNWAVWLHEYLTDLPDRQDELRYVLTSISPETKDAEFTWKDYQTRINSELVSIFGNFVNRVAVLCQKFYEGNVPSITTTQNEMVQKALQAMLNDVQIATDSMESNLDVFKIRDAQADWMNIARAGNKFLAETEPWKLIKTDPDAVQAIMFESIQLCAKLAVGANVFLPKTAQKLSEMFGVKNLSWQNIKQHSLVEPGQKLGTPEILFKPLEDETVLVQVQKLNEKRTVTKVETTPEILPAKPEISFDDFAKIDLRVGLVIAAEKVPKADKLLKLTVDLGFEKRTILSGIAEHYTPEMILGKQVTVVVNLAPRKIRGIESQGMLLMAGNGNQLVSIIPEQGIDPGSEIK